MTTRTKTLIALCAFALMAAIPAARALDGMRDDILAGMESKRRVVFVSQCGGDTGRAAMLLYVAAENRWELFEESNRHTVNAAGFSIENQRVKGLETNGGIYSYERVENLIGELIDAGFDLLAPFTVEKLRALKPRKDKCRYEE